MAIRGIPGVDTTLEDGNLGNEIPENIENSVLFVGNGRDGDLSTVTTTLFADYTVTDSGDNDDTITWASNEVTLDSTFLNIDNSKIYSGQTTETIVTNETELSPTIGALTVTFTLDEGAKLIKKGSVIVTDNQGTPEVWTDQGDGTLTAAGTGVGFGGAGVSATINYVTGEIELTYTSDPIGTTIADADYTHYNATIYKTDVEVTDKHIYSVGQDKYYVGETAPSSPLSEVATTGIVTVSGNPYESLDIAIKITLAGNPSTMKYKVSYDGGLNYGYEILSTASAIDLGYGISITFSGTNFYKGDIYTFTSTGFIRPYYPENVTRETYINRIGDCELKRYLDIFFNVEVVNLGSPASCWVVRPENDVTGSLGSLVEERISTGTISDNTITASGNPQVVMDLQIEIVLVGGNCETAKYRYTKDGGDTWSDPIVTPASSSTAYIGDGVTLTFTDVSNPWQIGDLFKYPDVTAPTSSDIMKGLTESISTPLLRGTIKSKIPGITNITVLGDTDLVDWTAMKTMLNELNNAKYKLTAKMHTAYRNGTPISTWVTNIVNEAKTFFDIRTQLYCYRANTPTQEVNSIIWGASKYAILPSNRDAKAVIDGSLTNLVSVVDEDDLKPYRETLAKAGFTVLMDHVGVDGTYFGNVYNLAPAKSDYQQELDIRVNHEVQRLIQIKSTQYVGRDIPASRGAIEGIVSEIRTFVKDQMGNKITNFTLELIAKDPVTELRTLKKIRLRGLINGNLRIDEIAVSVGYTSETQV